MSLDKVRGELDRLSGLMAQGKVHSMVPFLPLFFNLEGKPYTLKDHFPFEPMFSASMPRSSVWRCARQTAKSMSSASKGVLLANTISEGHFKVLYVTPLYEQIRRFSSNYVRPFIENSPLRSLMVGPDTEQNVLQRSFRNGSIMFFSYALLDADRIRGIKADLIAFDEVQNLNKAHIPIIIEVMSASRYKIVQYTGTPLTRDNTIEDLWSQSSMAEWVIKCEACNYYNIPSRDHHIDKMIGPWHEDIGDPDAEDPKKRGLPAVICAKCAKPINPRKGRWIHQNSSRKMYYAWYHVPQIILPMHYASRDAWSLLLAKQSGMANTTTAMFYNEVLGEAYDMSTKLVTKTDLERAGILNENTEEAAMRRINKYSHRALGVDWGGGGADGVSFTTIAVVGFSPDGRAEVIFGKRLLTPHDHAGEAMEVKRLFGKFCCHLLAHDYTGAGTLRETFLIQGGLDKDRVMPIQYVRSATANILNFIEATDYHPRNYYRVDKTRSLQLVSYAIKFGKIVFFKYDYKSADAPGLLHDFLALVEHKTPTNHAGDVYTIQKQNGFTDDFAHAVNLGCCALWHATGAWPKFTNVTLALPLTKDQDNALNGP